LTRRVEFGLLSPVAMVADKLLKMIARRRRHAAARQTWMLIFSFTLACAGITRIPHQSRVSHAFVGHHATLRGRRDRLIILDRRERLALSSIKPGAEEEQTDHSAGGYLKAVGDALRVAIFGEPSETGSHSSHDAPASTNPGKSFTDTLGETLNTMQSSIHAALFSTHIGNAADGDSQHKLQTEALLMVQDTISRESRPFVSSSEKSSHSSHAAPVSTSPRKSFTDTLGETLSAMPSSIQATLFVTLALFGCIMRCIQSSTPVSKKSADGNLWRLQVQHKLQTEALLMVQETISRESNLKAFIPFAFASESRPLAAQVSQQDCTLAQAVVAADNSQAKPTTLFSMQEGDFMDFFLFIKDYDWSLRYRVNQLSDSALDKQNPLELDWVKLRKPIHAPEELFFAGATSKQDLFELDVTAKPGHNGFMYRVTRAVGSGVEAVINFFADKGVSLLVEPDNGVRLTGDGSRTDKDGKAVKDTPLPVTHCWVHANFMPFIPIPILQSIAFFNLQELVIESSA